MRDPSFFLLPNKKKTCLQLRRFFRNRPKLVQRYATLVLERKLKKKRNTYLLKLVEQFILNDSSLVDENIKFSVDVVNNLMILSFMIIVRIRQKKFQHQIFFDLLMSRFIFPILMECFFHFWLKK